MPFTSIDGVKLHYLTQGDGDQPIVFVHGFCQSSVFWEPTLRLLPPAYRGYALDFKGFGDSDKPQGPYSIPLFADEIVAFLDALHLRRIVLVGNSMGGVVCQSFATRYGDRLAKLVLVSTGPNVRDPETARKKAASHLTAERTRGYFEAIVRGFFLNPPNTFERLVDVAAKASPEAMTQSSTSSASLDFLPALPGVRVPTLIVQGAQDTSRTPEDGALIQRAIPGSLLRLVEGAGHTPMLEQPNLFHSILFDFLAT